MGSLTTAVAATDPNLVNDTTASADSSNPRSNLRHKSAPVTHPGGLVPDDASSQSGTGASGALGVSGYNHRGRPTALGNVKDGSSGITVDTTALSGSGLTGSNQFGSGAPLQSAVGAVTATGTHARYEPLGQSHTGAVAGGAFTVSGSGGDGVATLSFTGVANSTIDVFAYSVPAIGTTKREDVEQQYGIVTGGTGQKGGTDVHFFPLQTGVTGQDSTTKVIAGQQVGKKLGATTGDTIACKKTGTYVFVLRGVDARAGHETVYKDQVYVVALT